MTDRFELVEELGRGGMGVVWRARDTVTGEVVALKRLHPQLTVDQDFVARFEREIEIARRIDSPNVVRVIGHGASQGAPFLVMEYVPGQSLRDLLRAKGPLPWPRVREIGEQVVRGLNAVHAAGVIHRDVKPSNILFDERGVAKIADFGIARAGDMTRMTTTQAMLGTPAYTAPDLDVTPASDFYSFGCVLYEALTGTPPFEAGTPYAMLQLHARREPDLSRLPVEARATVGALLDKEASTRALSLETRPTPTEQMTAARGYSAAGSNLSKRTRRNPIKGELLVVLASIGVIPVVLFGAYLLSNGPDRNGPQLSTPTAAPEAPTASVLAEPVPPTVILQPLPYPKVGTVAFEDGFHHAYLVGLSSVGSGQQIVPQTCNDIVRNLTSRETIDLIRNANPTIPDPGENCTNLQPGLICLDQFPRNYRGDGPPCLGAVRTEYGVIVVWGHVESSPIVIFVQVGGGADWFTRVISAPHNERACMFRLDVTSQDSVAVSLPSQWGVPPLELQDFQPSNFEFSDVRNCMEVR